MTSKYFGILINSVQRIYNSLHTSRLQESSIRFNKCRHVPFTHLRIYHSPIGRPALHHLSVSFMTDVDTLSNQRCHYSQKFLSLVCRLLLICVLNHLWDASHISRRVSVMLTTCSSVYRMPYLLLPPLLTSFIPSIFHLHLSAISSPANLRLVVSLFVLRVSLAHSHFITGWSKRLCHS